MIVPAGYQGDFAAGATIDVKVSSWDEALGNMEDIASGAVAVYKDNSTTQSTAGVTLTVTFDTLVGLANIRITTGSDGSFYAAGSNFTIVLTGGTIGGTDHAGFILGSFSIANRPIQSLAAGAIGLLGIAVAEVNRIADIVRRRTQANVEASSYGDTLDLSSAYGEIQQAQESAISGSTLTVKKTDGTTTLGTKTVTVDATTGNVTAIS